MTDLQRKALASLPMEPGRVETLYAGAFGGVAEKAIKNLCVSHERLRAELLGAETLLAETQAEVLGVISALQGYPDGCDEATLCECRDRLRNLLPESAAIGASR